MATQTESVDEAVGGTGPGGGASQGGDDRPGWPRGRIVALVLAVAALVAVFFVTRGDPEEATPSDDGAPRRYETYIDSESGFSLEHPDTWIPIARPDGSRRLLLSAGGDSSVSVRFEADFTREPIATAEDLAKLQPVIDRIAGSEGVQVVNRQALTVNGLPAIYYLSRFTDAATGENGANAQYFIFQGTDMYTLHFQAVPEQEFDRLAPEFDKILASFRGDPDYEAPPAPAE